MCCVYCFNKWLRKFQINRFNSFPVGVYTILDTWYSHKYFCTTFTLIMLFLLHASPKLKKRYSTCYFQRVADIKIILTKQTASKMVQLIMNKTNIFLPVLLYTVQKYTCDYLESCLCETFIISPFPLMYICVMCKWMITSVDYNTKRVFSHLLISKWYSVFIFKRCL